ncbi:TPA: hypothetical protein ACH3X2_004654 [Trebouxia sp. C0005]
MAAVSTYSLDWAAFRRLGYHYVEVLLEKMQRGGQAITDFLIRTTRKRQRACQNVSVLDEPYAGPPVKCRRTAVTLHVTTAVGTDHCHTGAAAVTSTDGQAPSVSQQQLTPPKGWKSPFTFTMGQQSRTVGQPRGFCHPHQNLYIPKSIFQNPVQLGRLQQAQQLKPRESNFCVARSSAATPHEASHGGVSAAPGLTSAPLVLSRPTAVQHAPADLPFLQRFIMEKQVQQEQRAQHDSQTRTLTTSGNNAASLSAPAVEHVEWSSDEPAEPDITDVPVAVWEVTPGDHNFVQGSDDERLPALPPSTAVDATPSAAAIMATDASVANITVPDTTRAEVAAVEPTVAVSSSTDTVLPDVAAVAITAAQALHDDLAAPATTAAEALHNQIAAPSITAAEGLHDGVAAPPITTAEALHDHVADTETTAAETVPINIAAGDTPSTDAQHADTARTTAAVDRSAAAPFAADMEAVLAQQSGEEAHERQQDQYRAAAKAHAGEAADAAAGSASGGYESSFGGGHCAADHSLLTEGHMASAAVTGGYGYMQQAFGKHVGHGSAEPSKMGSEPSASLPGPLGQEYPSICLAFPLLPFGGGMGSHGQPAFIPSPAAALAALQAKQKALARKARLSQRAAEQAAQKAAEEAAALQRVLGGNHT